MKNQAICIRCGSFKKDAFATCKECDLTPKTDFEAARALILSVKTSYGDTEIGKSLDELKVISEQIRAGRPYAIDGDEQTRVVRAYYSHLKSLPAKKWYQSKKFKWIIAGFLVMTIIAIIAFYMMR